MPNHSNTTVTHTRADPRRTYVRVYVCVSADQLSAIFDSDGLVIAWSDWDRAKRHADRRSMIVVNWSWFISHTLPRLARHPSAARLLVVSKRGEEKRFHVELDASDEELRTLNQEMDWYTERCPTKASKKNAKVWQEVAS